MNRSSIPSNRSASVSAASSSGVGKPYKTSDNNDKHNENNKYEIVSAQKTPFNYIFLEGAVLGFCFVLAFVWSDVIVFVVDESSMLSNDIERKVLGGAFVTAYVVVFMTIFFLAYKRT